MQYILIETNIDKNGQLQKNRKFKRGNRSNHLECSLAVSRFEKETKTLNVAVHRFGDAYYGVFYFKKRKKLFIKQLEF